MRDSAGIQIVENAAPQWRAGEEWRLSDEPALSIGELDGPDEYQLHQVRSAHRLGDGRILVANAGTHQLRIYDTDGRFVTAAGRQGGGPGEFQMIGGMVVDGDSVFVTDFRERRISIFTTEPAFVRSFPLSAGEGIPFVMPAGRFADGSWAVSATRVFGGPDTPPTGVVRDSSSYLRFREGSHGVDTLGRFPGAESYVNAGGSGGARFVSVSMLPFGRAPGFAVHGDRFVYGSSDRYEIGVYTSDGALERLIRRAHTPQPVTDDDIRELEEWQERQQSTRAGGGPPPGMPAMPKPSELPRPEAKPAYGRFLVDREGNLWVSEYTPPGEHRATWDIFTPEGQWLGSVTTPARFRVMDIGPDYVLGVYLDEFDVEHIQMYRLSKPGA